MTKIEFDAAEIRAELQRAIREQLTGAIKQSLVTEEVEKAIREAFKTPWNTGRQSWLAEATANAMEAAMHGAVSSAIKDAGVEEMIGEIVRAHVATEEFKQALIARTLETVRETTFYVRPSANGSKSNE